MSPLYDLLKKDTNFVWNTSHSAVFESLKVALSSAAIFHHPSLGSRLALSVDASNKGLGAVLKQISMDRWCPPAFFSRALNPAQLKYSGFDRELLAVTEAIRHFRHFLEGKILQSLQIIDRSPPLSIAETLPGPLVSTAISQRFPR